jgi:hypothetical protein
VIVTAPIADITSFLTLVQDILDTNPWACTTYQSAGHAMPAVSKTCEYYSGRIIYENGEAKTIG